MEGRVPEALRGWRGWGSGDKLGETGRRSKKTSASCFGENAGVVKPEGLQGNSVPQTGVGWSGPTVETARVWSQTVAIKQISQHSKPRQAFGFLMHLEVIFTRCCSVGSIV